MKCECSLLPTLLHAAGNNGDGAGHSQQAAAAAQQQLHDPPVVMLADGRLQQPAKLGAVVSDALRRWYLETEREALRGDVVRPLLRRAGPALAGARHRPPLAGMHVRMHARRWPQQAARHPPAGVRKPQLAPPPRPVSASAARPHLQSLLPHLQPSPALLSMTLHPINA